MKVLFLQAFFFLPLLISAQAYTTINGHLEFVSEAPLEIIKASSEQLQGVLDLDSKKFAFKVFIKSFEGFNNPLQQVHFYENYLEANDFPIATFQGKILEELLDSKEEYRAKGKLLIHGIEVERIIKVDLIIDEDQVRFKSDFTVALQDHNIALPRIVYQKIAEKINVNVTGELNRK